MSLVCALLSSLYADFEGNLVPVPDFLSDRFGWNYSMLWPIVPILIGFALVFSCVAMFALKNINYQRR